MLGTEVLVFSGAWQRKCKVGDISSRFLPASGLNLFPNIHDKCSLLSHLLLHFGGPYCKHYGSLRSSLIRIHSVCFQSKKKSVVHLNMWQML